MFIVGFKFLDKFLQFLDEKTFTKLKVSLPMSLRLSNRAIVGFNCLTIISRRRRGWGNVPITHTTTTTGVAIIMSDTPCHQFYPAPLKVIFSTED